MRTASRLVTAVVAAAATLAAAAVSPAREVVAAERACTDVPVSPFLDAFGVHAPSIDCAHWYGIVRGVAPDVFAPGTALRRDQMATIVAQAIASTGAPLPPPDDAPFDDLDGNVHRGAVERLAAAGVVQGRSGRTYAPDATVSRGQMATFLVRAWSHVAGTTPGDVPDAFGDDDGHPHERSIDQGVHLGLLAGRDGGTFGPEARTGRGALATFVTRLLDRFVVDGTLAPAPAVHRSVVSPLPASLRRVMTGRSWREGCPVALDDLRLVEVVHVGMDGRDRWGLLVVHADVAADVADVFARLHAAGFAIRRMQLVDRYAADDDLSMAADNTSGFNCRYVAGTDRWSQHAYGTAIDLNPVENPYVRDGQVEPPAGRDYLDRSDVRPGMIVSSDAVVEAFAAIGWGWGGDWLSAKDYQHFSASGN